MEKRIIRTKIVKTPHEKEWVVKAYSFDSRVIDQSFSTVRYPDADYFASDKQDAIETAKLMLVNGEAPEE